MASRKTQVALAAVFVGAAAVAVVTATGMPGTGEPATELAGARSTAGDGYGNRGDLFVATQDNRLYRYDKLGTGRQELSVAVTGLAAGEKLVGIDTRPANGQLYAVGSTGRLYVIDPISGQAAPVGAAFATPLSGKRFGVDFNPTVDRLRIVSDTGQNLRIDPTTGAVAGVDTALDRPGVTGAAYTNSVAGATTTALYDIDSKRDSLVLQGSKPGVTPVVSPNTGRLFPVGRLGVDVLGLDGFDIVGAARGATFTESDYTAVAAVKIKGVDDTRLVRIDLGSGKATVRARLPRNVVGITASAGAPTTVYATTARNDLVSFDRDTLRIRSQRPITGLGDEKVLGIDVRPANGQLYALTSANQIYTVNPLTAVATKVGVPFSPAVFGKGVGFDVNPVVDRLRVVTSSGQNLRLVPDTAAVAGVDKALSYAKSDRKPQVAHAAYTDNRVGAAATTLYDIDTARDVLAVQNPPNDGTLTVTGKLRLDVDSAGGFDIAADGDAVAALSRGDRSRVYTIDLRTGQARLVGKLGRGSVLTSLTVAPRGV